MPSYCRQCYRPIAVDRTHCSACDSEPSGLARVVMLIGLAGLPLLIIGMGSLNVRLCVAGATVSGVATLVYAVMSMR